MRTEREGGRGLAGPRALAARVARSRILVTAMARIPLGSGVILRYHSVSDDAGWADDYIQESLVTSPDVFERQVAFLASRYRIVGMDEVASAVREKRPLDSRAVAITFDDGYEDNHRFALPILLRHGAKATFYVTTGAVGDETVLWTVRVRHAVRRSTRSDLSLSFLEGRRVDISTAQAKEHAVKLLTAVVKRAAFHETVPIIDEIVEAAGASDVRPSRRVLMSWDDVRSMHAAGMTIGAHTVSHLNLPRLDTADVVREVRDCKAELERALGARVAHFAYPDGRTSVNFDGRVAAVVAAAGLRSAVTSVTGPVSPRSSEYALPRLGVRQSASDLGVFECHIQRARFTRPRHPGIEDVRRAHLTAGEPGPENDRDGTVQGGL